MRIAIICNTCPQAVDEDSLFPATWDLASRLTKGGHEVLVISPVSAQQGLSGAYTLGGIKVFRTSLPAPEKKVFNAYPALANMGWLMSRSQNLFIESQQILKDFRPDVLETQEFFGLGLLLLSNKICPTVVRCHGSASFMFKEGYMKGYSEAEIALLEGLEGSSVLLGDAVIAVCNDVAQRLSDASGRDIADFHIVSNPLALPDSYKKTYELSTGGPRLVFWGHVARLKGADLLIDALPIVARRFPNLHLSMIGTHAFEVGANAPYSDTLKQKLTGFGLIDNVTFYGHQPRKRIFELALQSDLGVFPSRYETACYSNLEAMSLGLPVVASRVGGLKEYCQDQINGLLFDSGNYEDLAAKIIQILEDGNLRTQLGKAARQRVAEFCNPELNLQSSIELYTKVINASNPAASSSRKASALLINKLYETAEAPLSVPELEAISPAKASSELGEQSTIESESIVTSQDFSSVPTRSLARELGRRVKRKLVNLR